VARSHELQAGGFSAEFSVEEYEGDGVMETDQLTPMTPITERYVL